MNNFPEPICDGKPTRRDIFFACLLWIGVGAVGGCAAIYYLGVGVVRVF